MTGATAAAVVALAARRSEVEGLVAQALALRTRLVAFAEADAEVYAASLEALAAASGGGDERRDFELGTALAHAAQVPLLIAEAAADVAMLAAEAAATVTPEAQADAQGAAALAAGAATAAARLVEVNLASAPGDERVQRAHIAVQRARDATAESVPRDSVQSAR
jgi:formiminotetrahydrofolate cyclodeaminase